MTVDDMQINHEVRSLFARNWVRTDQLDIAVTSGTIYVRGRMLLLNESQLDPSPDRDRGGVGPRFLTRLEEELLKINNARAVVWELDGWRRTGMGWRSGAG
jgi:hypothetical protein